MNRKRLLSLLLISLLLLLTACNNNKEKNNNEEEAGDEVFELTGTYNPADYVELGQYKGFSVEVTVTDEEVEQRIQDLLDSEQKYEEIKEGEVKKGDTVNMDYEGKVDGELFEGGSKEGHDLEIGSNEFIPGFEDQIIGHKVGEEFVINVTFPEKYENNEELSGKAAEFKVKLNYIQGEKLKMEFNDEFVKSLDEGFETTEDYRKNLLKEMKDEKKDEELSKMMNKVIEGSTFKDFPSEMMEAMNKRFDAINRVQAKQYFETFDQYMEYMGLSTEDYDKYVEDTSKGYLKELMVSELIVKKENMEITQEEQDEMLDTYKKNYEMEEDELKKYFIDEYKILVSDVVHEYIIMDKATIFVEEQTKVTIN